MKYFVYSYNYFTLYKALFYAEYYWGKDNTTIFYAEDNMECPLPIEAEYNIVKLRSVRDMHNLSYHKKLITESINSKVLFQDFSMRMDEIEKTIIVLFRDNCFRECTLMDKLFSQKNKKEFEVWLIEEGAALYNTPHKSVKMHWQDYLIRMFCVFIGLSRDPLKRNCQGTDTRLNKIICRYPGMLKERLAENNVKAELQEDVFKKDYCEKFIEMICGSMKPPNADFIFLSQPINECSIPFLDPEKAYGEFLSRLFGVLTQYGNVLIKQHPRDTYNFEKYISDKVFLLSANQKLIPFECFRSRYDSAHLISLYSSACDASGMKNKGILLLDLLSIKGLEQLITPEYLNKNNLIRCHSFEELEQVLFSESRDHYV